jgi:hypothetical protein
VGDKWVKMGDRVAASLDPHQDIGEKIEAHLASAWYSDRNQPEASQPASGSAQARRASRGADTAPGTKRAEKLQNYKSSKKARRRANQKGRACAEAEATAQALTALLMPAPPTLAPP